MFLFIVFYLYSLFCVLFLFIFCFAFLFLFFYFCFLFYVFIFYFFYSDSRNHVFLYLPPPITLTFNWSKESNWNYPQESTQHSEHGESLKSRLLTSSLPSIRMSAWHNSTPTGRFFMKCCIWMSNFITYFAAISLFRSWLLSRATEVILYKTLIRPAVSYGAEAWTVTKKEEQATQICERKMF